MDKLIETIKFTFWGWALEFIQASHCFIELTDGTDCTKYWEDNKEDWKGWKMWRGGKHFLILVEDG